MPININGVSSSANLQQLQNVNNDLPTEEEVKKASEKPVAEEVQKPDAAKVKEEAESLVQKKDGLGEKSAEKFAEGNKVEVAKDGAAEKTDGAKQADGKEKTDAAAKKDGDITAYFKQNPCAKILLMAFEQILASVIEVISKISSKLPKGVGDIISGGLSMVKGFMGIYKFDDLEKDAGKYVKGVMDGYGQMVQGLFANIPDVKEAEAADKTEDAGKTENAEEQPVETTETTTAKKPCLAAQIINNIGKMCNDLSSVQTWEDAVNIVGMAVTNIVVAKRNDVAGAKLAALEAKDTKGMKEEDVKALEANKAKVQAEIDKNTEVGEAIRNNIPNFTKAFSRGANEIKTAYEESQAKKNEKIVNALSLYKQTLLESSGLSEEDKKFIAVLSDCALSMVGTKGAKKAIESFEATLGSLVTDYLSGRNKKAAEQTLAMVKKLRAAGNDPFAGVGIVLETAKEVSGGKVDEIGVLQKLVADTGKTVENATKAIEENGGKADEKTAKVEAEVKEKVAKEVAEVKEAVAKEVADSEKKADTEKKSDSEEESDIEHMS